jgi:hypothetical protein
VLISRTRLIVSAVAAVVAVVAVADAGPEKQALALA